jgi:hypothetical protein
MTTHGKYSSNHSTDPPASAASPIEGECSRMWDTLGPSGMSVDLLFNPTAEAVDNFVTQLTRGEAKSDDVRQLIYDEAFALPAGTLRWGEGDDARLLRFEISFNQRVIMNLLGRLKARHEPVAT